MAKTNLVVVHRPNKNAWEFQSRNSSWVVWSTCLRSLALGHVQIKDELKLQAGDEIFEGAQAYRFCLEVICGLHSPVVGETEVFGQFKKLVGSPEVEKSACGRFLHRLFEELIADAKEVRHKCLTHLGGQSYGSLTRKKMKGLGTIHIVGAGQLVREILPWLAKETQEIIIYCRNPAKASDLVENYPHVTVKNFEVLTKALTGGLIVAAPITRHQFWQWGQGCLDNVEKILDLRGDSEQDNLRHPATEDLAAVFRAIEKTKHKRQEKVQAARQLIKARSEQLEVEMRA